MGTTSSIRTNARLHAFVAAAMAISFAGIAVGGVVSPVRGMGPALLGTMLVSNTAPERVLGVEQTLVRASLVAPGSGLLSASGGFDRVTLPVERTSSPGRGDLPPPGH